MKTNAIVGMLAAGALLCGVALPLTSYAQVTVDSYVTTNLVEPHSIALDPDGNSYITDGANNRILKYDPATSIFTIIAGRAGTSGTNDGVGITARFYQPQGLLYARGGLVVADSANQLIRFVSLNGIVTNLAGVAAQTGYTDGPGSTARFRYPVGLALDQAGNIYIADSKNNAVRKLDTNNQVTTVATGFYEPAAVTVGDNGDLWVADTRRHVIQRITTNGVVELVAGSAGVAGTADAIVAEDAQFATPRGLLWLGHAIGLLISDTGNHTIRRLYYNPSVSAFSVETFAGMPGQSGLVNGPAHSAMFNSPIGLVRDIGNGGFLVVDRANNQVRRITSQPPQPPIVDPQIGWIAIVKDAFGDFVTKLFPVTSSVFNNDVVIGILAELGTQTYFTHGPTPPNVFEDNIPSPGPTTGLTPPFYRDGRPPSEMPPTMLQPEPDMTIKAISTLEGRRPSRVVQARFQFKAGNPQIAGDNAAAFELDNVTRGAQMWYTIDGSEPTNSIVNSTSIGPKFAGDRISLLIGDSNLTFRVRAYKPSYKPSDIVTKVFSPSNFVANTISFGFEAGEASSEFVGAAGQRFYAPVVLSVLPKQTIYSLQFNATFTNLTGTPLDGSLLGFETGLLRPIPGITPVEYEKIPPAMFVGFSGMQPVFTNLLVTNPAVNLIGVGWLERRDRRILFDSTKQDLITYSQAHDTLFESRLGKVILGGVSFVIPDSARDGHTYLIRLGRATATADGVAEGVYIQLPTNGSLTIGPVNSEKVVTVRSRKYVVGDVAPFRWFNAGDFGEGVLENNDVLQVFQSAVYEINNPPEGSDFFDAMDSSDGSSTALAQGTDRHIDTIQYGDGLLAVDDVFVTFRRSLDPSRKWFARYWTNGIRRVAEVPNRAPNSAPALTSTKAAVPPPTSSVLEAQFTAGDAVASSGSRLVQVPIHARLTGEDPIRALMLNVTVVPLDDAPPLDQRVEFVPHAGLGTAAYTDSRSFGNYAGVWLNTTVPGVGGTNLLGTLNVSLPADLPTTAAYLVRLDHLSASPNGLVLFRSTIENGLITLADRSASTWDDAIPDSWRLRHFGSLSNLLSAANADADGDGVVNLSEFRAGTDPNNIRSKLELLSSSLNSNGLGGIRLLFPTVDQRRYVLESATTLGAELWTAISGQIIGDGRLREFIDTNATARLRFYRVRVVE